MRLSKVLFGAFFVAVFLFLSWGVRLLFTGEWSVCNSAGAFGFDLSQAALLMVSGGILVFFGVQWWKESTPRVGMAWLFLLAGGLSNLFERLVYGCVSDYIRLGAFPVFNIADVFLTIGVLGVLLSAFCKRNEKGMNVKTQITNAKSNPKP